MIVYLDKNANPPKNAGPNKYVHGGYGTGFDSCSEFSLTNGSVGRNAIIFGTDMSSSVQLDNKGKDFLILGKDPMQRLDDTTLAADAQYSIIFSRSNRTFCFSLHSNWSNGFLFVNATKINQFNAKGSEITNYKYFMKFSS